MDSFYDYFETHQKYSSDRIFCALLLLLFFFFDIPDFTKRFNAIREARVGPNSQQNQKLQRKKLITSRNSKMHTFTCISHSFSPQL